MTRLHHVMPSYAFSDLETALELAQTYRLPLDPWQEDLVRELLAETAAGLYAAQTYGISLSRRNGKTHALIVVILYHLLVNKHSVVYTAHLQKTAMETWNVILDLFTDTGLKKFVKNIRRRTAEEQITLTTGASFRVLTRTKKSGRGIGADLLILDEASWIADGAMEAMVPMLANSLKPQIVLVSSPPTDFGEDSEAFGRVRTNALESKDPTVGWSEWSIAPDDDLDDMEAIRRANPAMQAGRLTEGFVQTERTTLSDRQFAIERGGLWNPKTTQVVFDPQTWIDAQDQNAYMTQSIFLGVDVSNDRQNASISAAGLTEDGIAVIEQIESRTGTAWIIPTVTRIVKDQDIEYVVIDGRGASSSLLEDLEDAGLKVIVTTANEMMQAAGTIYDEIHDGTVKHLGQPPMNAAARTVRKRKLMEGFAFAPVNSSADITPFIAATLALYGLRSRRARAKAKEKAKEKTGRALFV